MIWKAGIYLILVVFYFYSIHSGERWNQYPDETLSSVFVKILPIAALTFFTLTTDVIDGVHVHLKQNVVLGLVFSLLGDVCLVWRVDLLLPGMVFFAIAHLFYIRAFKIRPIGDAKTALTSTIPGVVAFFVLFLPRIEDTSLKVVGIIYASLISIMWWRSLIHFRTKKETSNKCACAGAFIFMTSDFLISVDNWLINLPYASLGIMTTYYTAQLAIATAVLSYKTGMHKIK